MPKLRTDALFFIALMATALALGGALAHALELPNKIGLERDEYLIVQKVYRGWNQLAYLLIAQLASMTAVAFLSRRQPRVFRRVGVAIICLLAAQTVFWAFTYPANVATQNWAVLPDNWQNLRRQWEYSHAAGAAFQVLAMAALILAALARPRASDREALV